MAEINNRSGQGDSQLLAVLDSLLADITAVRALFGGMLSGSDTWDAGSIADGDEEVKEITVTGAALGDFVLVSASIDVADLALVGQVTEANKVTVQLLNNTGGAIDLGSMTVHVRVIPRAAFVAPAALTTTT
jgi:hypothetical protein